MGKTKKNNYVLTGRRPARKAVATATATKTVKKNTSSHVNTNVAKTIVPTFLHMINTVKLYHWKTTSFATHKATDELYGALNDKIDEFVEVMLGKNELGGRAKLLKVNIIKLDIFSNNDAFRKQIEIYKTFLLNLSKDATFSALMNADLLAIRDEILADLNKFLYLLTLH
jgi:DNA-binding ferritin-like protein